MNVFVDDWESRCTMNHNGTNGAAASPNNVTINATTTTSSPFVHQDSDNGTP